MYIGYARVSTKSQNPSIQIEVLKEYGVEERNIFLDYASGAKEERKALQQLLMTLRKGDTLVVYNLSRLGRNLKHLLILMETFNEIGVEFKSIMESFLDTNTPEGNLIFNIFGALNQFHRERNREVVMKGIRNARKQGRVGGRPKGISQALKNVSPGVASMYRDGSTLSEIQKVFPMANASIFKCLKHQGVDYDNVREIRNRKLKKKRK